MRQTDVQGNHFDTVLSQYFLMRLDHCRQAPFCAGKIAFVQSIQDLLHTFYSRRVLPARSSREARTNVEQRTPKVRSIDDRSNRFLIISLSKQFWFACASG